jgi:hypothetical protein
MFFLYFSSCIISHINYAEINLSEKIGDRSENKTREFIGRN